MPAPKCLSCAKSLEQGFLQDHGHAANYDAAWVAGPPERGFLGGVKLRGRTRLGVLALRCTNCGLLHLYAPGDRPAA